MPTVNQLKKNPRKRIKKYKGTRHLKQCPQKKCIIAKVYRVKPKKPNSAQRKVAKVRLTTGKNLQVYLPGLTYGLLPQAFSSGLVRGGRVRDLPGIRLKLIRGKYDLSPVVGCVRSRSKYGAKRPMFEPFFADKNEYKDV